MKKSALVHLLTLGASLSLTSCHQTGHTNTSEDINPLFKASTLPFQAPPFDKIRDANFKPALEKGIADRLREVDSIAGNSAKPTFENTLMALEKSGQLLNRANLVFLMVSGANTNPILEKLQEEEAPKLAASEDAVYLNSALYKRVHAVYLSRDSVKLDSESQFLAEYYELKFQLAGAALNETKKDSLKKLNKEEAALGAKFTNQLLGAAKAGALVITKSSDLEGLSEGDRKAAAENAKTNKKAGAWLLSLRNTTQQPALQSLKNRPIRRNFFEASYNRAEKGDTNDTRKTILQIASIRARKAALLGYPNYAAWALTDQMAKTPEAVDAFLSKLVPGAIASASREAKEIQQIIDGEKGGFQLAPWDWTYYAEKLRKEKYDLNEDEVKPYFELDTVLAKGVFYAANLLYGITFKERKDLPVYQPDVRVFDVMDKDGSQIGLFYCDYFKRDNKSGGAWMSNVVNQSKLLGTKPVIYNVCNFTKPAPGNPALISFDDVTTMFHEFGHGLHGLFASQQYPSLSGTNTARDFVEFPSQFNEHWAMDPKVLAHYAVHYKTGAPMPKVLVDKIKKAAGFDQGYGYVERLAATALDLEWHKIKGISLNTDVDAFEADALKRTHFTLTQVPTRYRSTYFLHIWGNGYAAGYYAYAWTKMLDEDAFAWFQSHGGLTRENGQRFRDLILSRGHTEDYGEMFRKFTGHDPDIKPMLESGGLH